MSRGRLENEARERVAAHFQHRCAYCRSPVSLFPGSQQLDHIIPSALGGSDAEENLCLCCPWCNARKGDRIAAADPVTRRKVRLFHPLEQKWARHFTWSADSIQIDDLIVCGRATIAALDLNNRDLLEARRIWILAGWHPPGENET